MDTLLADDGIVYSTVSLNDCIISGQEGSPNLPKKIITLIIPADEEADKIVLTKGKGEIISLLYPIIPVQKPIPTSLDFEGNEFVTPDISIYEKNEFFPLEQSRILRTNCIRGNKVVVIEVSPILYNPVLAQLEYFESIDVNLHLKSSTKKLKKSKVKNKEKYDNYLKALVDNKSDVDLYSVIEEQDTIKFEGKSKSALSATSITMNCEYVVITPASLASYFNDFIEWKKQKGIDIELITTELIYQNYSGDYISGIYDNAGKIRQFLNDACLNGLEYALLGEDNTKVPIRYGTGYNNNWNDMSWNDETSQYDTIFDAFKIPSDLYFSDFDGDWNVDSDQYLGEKDNDNVDYGAEIFVGRLLVNNGTQIQNWTNKLLLYEQNLGNGSTAYLRRALYCQADHMQRDGQATDIANRFGSIFSTDIIFEEEYNGVPNYNSIASPQFPTGNQVISEMNSGYGFVSWFNHGAPHNIGMASKGLAQCGTNDIKKVTNFNSTRGWCGFPETANGLDNLNNSTKPFVLYTIACESIPFDTFNGTAPTSNLGAQITNQSAKGGPIYLGNTRYGWVLSSWYLQQSFTSQITGGTYQLGAAEANSKGSSGIHFVWLSHNLLGCPETEMWTNTPSQLTNASVGDCGSYIKVNTGGVTGCKVCVMSANDNGASYYSVAEGLTQCTFYNVPTLFVVTITKHNYLPKVFESVEIPEFLTPVISGPVTTKCGYTNNYTLDIDNAQYGTSFSWTSDVLSISNNTQSTCTAWPTYNDIGTIYCAVTSTCGTKTGSKTIVAICDDLKLVFVPNPASEETTLSIESKSKQQLDEFVEWEYEVYNSNQRLKEKKGKIRGNEYTMNLSSWERGVYVVKVVYGESVITGKLIIE